ncbi:MAG: hypothetical protein COT17_07945 [Elusimicrobia bacterium CG08_land_8_20_14_0_20_51_18]|nr:MAG: hypothetical protein COT17_07945 [Elusimicrobia bacterium CG08_land_8_20_14_0_20_51_18]
MTAALSGADFLVLSFSLGLLLFIAYFSGREQKDTSDFFVARRRIPLWAATLSFVATEISAMTIVGVPAVGFKENWQYLQFFIGSAMARVFIGYFFIPAFYKYNCVTIYEFLGHRFGRFTQYSGSVFFFLTRLFASGVRLYAASLAVSVIMGWPLLNTIAVFTVISMAFIAFGGIRAVVWTGLWESVSFYLAGGLVFFHILGRINGGFWEFLKVAGEHNKLSLLNLGFNLSDPNILLIAVINGVFGSMAAFGTDQELMQRLLTLSTREESRKSIIWTIAATLPLVAICLGIGTALFVFFVQNPSFALPANSDEILAYFTVNFLPAGLKGLMLSAIILASIDSPLSSLSSSFVMDIYKPVSGITDETKLLRVSRMSIVVFGVILAAMAYACKQAEGMLWLAFKVNGLTAGSLLGIFLFGLFTRRKADKTNAWSMALAFLSCLTVLVLTEKKIITIGWSWLIVIGTTLTFVLSWALSSPAGAEERT